MVLIMVVLMMVIMITLMIISNIRIIIPATFSIKFITFGFSHIHHFWHRGQPIAFLKVD